GGRHEDGGGPKPTNGHSWASYTRGSCDYTVRAGDKRAEGAGKVCPMCRRRPRPVPAFRPDWLKVPGRPGSWGLCSGRESNRSSRANLPLSPGRGHSRATAAQRSTLGGVKRMYSLVLATMLTAAADAPQWGGHHCPPVYSGGGGWGSGLGCYGYGGA